MMTGTRTQTLMIRNACLLNKQFGSTKNTGLCSVMKLPNATKFQGNLFELLYSTYKKTYSFHGLISSLGSFRCFAEHKGHTVLRPIQRSH